MSGAAHAQWPTLGVGGGARIQPACGHVFNILSPAA